MTAGYYEATYDCEREIQSSFLLAERCSISLLPWQFLTLYRPNFASDTISAV